MKYLSVAFLAISMLFVCSLKTFASGFNLKTIGSVDTGGRQISHWWYTSSSPALHGEALPGESVTIDVDGSAVMINADSSGNWDYALSSLAVGDHQIKLTNSTGSNINFTLTIGTENVNWDAVGKGTGEALPTAGTSWPTVIAIVGGVAMMGLSGRMLNVQKE